MKTTQDRWEEAQKNLRDAERAAGIGNQVTELEKRNPAISTLDSERQVESYRKIVFAIPDKELRRNVIYWNNECYRRFLQVQRRELNEMYERLENAGAAKRKEKLWAGMMICIFAIGIGDYFFETKGALVGAAISLLYGFDSLLHADRSNSKEKEAIKGEIVEQESFLKNLSDEGDFSAAEEFSAEQES